MSRVKTARVTPIHPSSGEPAKKPTELRLASSQTEVAYPTLATGVLLSVEEDTLTISIGGNTTTALRDPSVHPIVVRGAAERGERVLCERQADGRWLVIGALRAQPTPGIDVASDYTIEADTVVLRGRKEVTLVTEAAGLVVRAIGEVETYAERILSRAEGVHKIVGRMLKLN